MIFNTIYHLVNQFRQEILLFLQLSIFSKCSSFATSRWYIVCLMNHLTFHRLSPASVYSVCALYTDSTCYKFDVMHVCLWRKIWVGTSFHSVTVGVLVILIAYWLSSVLLIGVCLCTSCRTSCTQYLILYSRFSLKKETHAQSAKSVQVVTKRNRWCVTSSYLESKVKSKNKRNRKRRRRKKALRLMGLMGHSHSRGNNRSSRTQKIKNVNPLVMRHHPPLACMCL